MNYIELLGLPASGKTFLKNKLEKKGRNNFKQCKYLILENFFFSIRDQNLNKIRTILLLLLNSNIVNNLKPKIRSQGLIGKSNKLIIFKKTRRSFFLRVFDLLKLDDHYEKILNILKIRHKINIDKLYILVQNEIKTLNQNKIFKKKLNRWILENMILIEILKKDKNIHCIMDEGLFQRIFLIYSLSYKKKKFIHNVVKYFKPFGKVIYLNTNLKNIMERSNQRAKLTEGYIYKNMSELSSYNKEFLLFKEKIKKNFKIFEVRKL